MKLIDLLVRVAGRGESNCRDVYAEIARDHLHEVVQLAAKQAAQTSVVYPTEWPKSWRAS